MRISLPEKEKWQILGILCLIPLILAEDDPNDDAEIVVTEPAVAGNSNTKDDWIKALNEEKCGKRRKGCCEQLYIGDEETLAKCFALHQSKMPAENDKDPAKLATFLSCFVECFYKQKKFVGKGENVNMKMVKADAERAFRGRPKEIQYHIKMMEFCRKDALKLYGIVKMNPAGGILLRDACKPYFLFVFLCQAEYTKKQSCPYFVWEGKENSAMEEQCTDGKERCYEIDGIYPP